LKYLFLIIFVESSYNVIAMKFIPFLFFPLLFISCGFQQVSDSDKIFKVQAFTVKSDSSLTTLSFPGRVKSSEEVNLSFKVSGTINCVNVKEGDSVHEGMFLASIDPKDYQLQLSAAEAQYNQIKAEAERVIRLYKDSVVSANDYDKARFGIEQIQAKLDFARNQLSDCKLYAPFNGYVHRIFFDPSSIVTSGMPVISFLSAGVPEIEIDVPAYVYRNSDRVKDIKADLSSVSGDSSVSLALSSFSPKANANQLYTVRLSIASKLKTLPNPGMIAMVSLLFESSSKLSKTLIPLNSVFESDGKSNIWIISDDGTVHMKQVSILSVESNGMISIEGNIPENTQIVSAGVHKLVEGQKVEVMDPVSKTNIGGIL